MTKKIEAIERFGLEHPGVALEDYNFYPRNSMPLGESAGDSEGWEGQEELKTWQRLLRVCPDVEAANTLKEKGFDSALGIAAANKRRFVEDMAPHLGEGGRRLATEIHKRAEDRRNQVMLLAAGVKAAASPLLRAAKVEALPQEDVDYLTKLPSYEELFGPMEGVKEDSGMTVLGPPAYLTDLLRVADRYLSVDKSVAAENTFAGRRPDILKLPLTKENTENLLPYISLVNERLAGFLGEKEEKDLALERFPFSLPLHMPLRRIRLSLEEFHLSLSQILSATDAEEGVAAGESLGLSAEQRGIIGQAQASQAELQVFFATEDLTKLSKIEYFCRQTGLDKSQLHDLLYQDLPEEEMEKALVFFHNQGLKEPLRFNREEDAIPGLETGDVAVLDRLNRILRLQRAMKWRFSHLDYAIRRICAPREPKLDEKTLAGLAEISRLMERLGLSPGEACAMLYDLRTDGNGRELPCFQGAFKGKRPISEEESWDLGDPDSQVTQWISEGLSLSQANTLALARGVFGEKEKVRAGDENLSLLYRRAALCNAAGLDADSFPVLFRLAGGKDGGPAREAGRVMDAALLLEKTSMNACELDYILTGTKSSFVDPLYREEEAEKWLEALPSLVEAGRAADGKAGGNAGQREDQQARIKTLLASFFAAAEEEIQAAMNLAAITDLAALFLEGKEGMKGIRALSRRLILLRKLGLSTEETEGIAGHLNRYGIGSLDAPDCGDMAALTLFKRLRAGDRAGNLLAFLNLGDEEVGAKFFLGLSKERFHRLLEHFNGRNPLSQAAAIADLQELARIMGADPFYLLDLSAAAGKKAEDAFADYEKADQDLRHLLKGRFSGDGEGWKALAKKLFGRAEAFKRDRLVDMALAQCRQKEAFQWIASSGNLYEYLLMDVEMDGSTSISRIKEGINAIQLYLNRCRQQMEPGVTTENIPQVFWEWLSSYTAWEANRRIFLYPENYMEPSQRAAKTSLFADLENTLRQKDVTPQSVEEGYRVYLERFAKLAQLVYVDGYYCRITDTRRDDAATLFLFARTQTQPYEYYYITKEPDGIWTEWKPVNISINAETLCPVYAFQKLFVFWTEIKQAGEDGEKDGKSSVYQAALRYAFYNFSGDWVQPQTLASGEPITPDKGKEVSSYNGLFTKEMFAETSPAWRKAYPLHLEKGRYYMLDGQSKNSEKLILFYGPMLDTEKHKGWKMPEGQKEPDASDKFGRMLYNCARYFAFLLNQGEEGFLPVCPAAVITEDLEKGFLQSPEETVFLNRDKAGKTGRYRPAADRSSGALSLALSRDVIHDNGDEGQIEKAVELEKRKKVDKGELVLAGLTDGQARDLLQKLAAEMLDSSGMVKEGINLDLLAAKVKEALPKPVAEKAFPAVMDALYRSMGSPVLSKAMRDKSYTVIPVKNHPAALLLKGEKEAFLLSDPGCVMEPVSRGLLNGGNLFSQDAFLCPAIGLDAGSSKAIFDQLVFAGFLSDIGRLNESVSCKALKDALAEMLQGEAKADQEVAVILNILAGRPVFQKDAFLCQPLGLGQKESETIYAQLAYSGYLDQAGRLTLGVNFYDLAGSLADIFAGEAKAREMCRFVLDTLFQTAFPSGLSYLPKPEEGAACFRFQASRLTTAAVHKLSASLFTGGIDRLLRLSSQQIPVPEELPYSRFSLNDVYVAPPLVQDGAQVDFDGTYGPYYWELFFHGPMYVSSLLFSELRFSEAERWMKYIFDPHVPLTPVAEEAFQAAGVGIRQAEEVFTVLSERGVITKDGQVAASFTSETDLTELLSGILQPVQISGVKSVLLNHKLLSPLSRFWQFQPLRNRGLEDLLDALSNPRELAAYNAYPFDPDAIAGLRPGAYEKWVLMRYIDNLVSWGDLLFTQFTWESITSASMLYTFASDLLGQRPMEAKEQILPPPVTFEKIKESYGGGKIPQFLIDLEHISGKSGGSLPETPLSEADLYFAIPENRSLASYWDRVEDRLYKIRHGMDIHGNLRNLALFEPSVDPARLIQAAVTGGGAFGVSGGGTGVPVSYRFPLVLAKARELCQYVIQLGSGLLSALEKKDGERLSALRNAQEQAVLNLGLVSKQKAAEEAEKTLDSLKSAKDSAVYRKDHYKALYDENVNATEIAGLALLGGALAPQAVAIGIRGTAIAGYLLPNTFGLANGGMQFGDAINMGAAIADGSAALLSQTGSIVNLAAQYDRRRQEWELQHKTLEYEEKQLEKQISAAAARAAAAKQEVLLQQESIRQAGELSAFLKNKFTGEELYQWMAGRLSSLYMQMWRMALSAANAAQWAYQNEMACDTGFLCIESWDSLRRGLLAGEGLMLSLCQMEKAYMEKNTRSLEIEKTISLSRLDPRSFMAFRSGAGGEQGVLSFEISEKMLDFDFPGHYLRRIKSVSITIPAVAGPYQSVHAVLSQESSVTVMAPHMDAVRHAMDPAAHPVGPGLVRENWLCGQKIALSRAIEDPGLFVLNFADDQYLPFEGTGAVSKWTLRMPPATNRIDFSGISDVILQIRYTARDGGSAFARKVMEELKAEKPPYPYKMVKEIDLRHAFPADWKKGMEDFGTGTQRFRFTVTDRILLPNLGDYRLSCAAVIFALKAGTALQGEGFAFLRTSEKERLSLSVKDNAGEAGLSGGLPAEASWQVELDLDKTPQSLMKDGHLDPDVLKDISVLIQYEANPYGTLS